MDYSPGEAAELLDVAPATLRRWNVQFGELLSEPVSQSRRPGRRYSESDIAVLSQVGALLRSGLTYDEVRERIAGELAAEAASLAVGRGADSAHDARPAVGDTVLVLEHEATAELERALHASQQQIEQLREEVQRLERENQMLQARPGPARRRAGRGIGYWAGVALTLGSLLALIGISVALLFNADLLRDRRDVDTLDRSQPAATSTAGMAQSPASAARLIESVAAAEAALRTGELTATREYGGGASSSTHVRFDLGDGQQEPRLHVVTTYRGAREAETVERLLVGGQTWQRQPDGSWSEQPAQEDVETELRAFLPRASTIVSAEAVGAAEEAQLRWHDFERNADLTLLVDPATGIPRELSQVLLTTGEALTVVYSGWGTPVELPSPLAYDQAGAVEPRDSSEAGGSSREGEALP